MAEQKGEPMRLLFNLMTTIEIPHADKFPPKEVVENDVVDLFRSYGMEPRGLEITNYCADDEGEGGRV